MTNADKIRAMNDDELADFLSDITRECQMCYGCENKFCRNSECLDWLKKEQKNER